MKDKKQKRFVQPALILSLLFLFSHSPFSEARVPPVSAKSALVISLKDWQLLYDKSSDRRLPMASTTKVMTALLTVQYLQGEEDVLISESATAVPPVKLGLREGERYQADDLLYGLLLYSANDAGVALAEKVAGTEERFAEMMNEKARELGAFNTRFNNSTGLPGEGQYTTVSDLAIILHNALKNQKIQKIMQTKYILFGRNGKNVTIKNKNKLLWECPWTIGGKTGFTRMAGHCYVGEFKNEDNEFIIALLGSKRLWADASALVDYGNRSLTSPAEEESPIAPKIKKPTKARKKIVLKNSKRRNTSQQYASESRTNKKLVRQAKKKSTKKRA